MESKNIRTRKGLLVLPVLIIPFLTLAFWAGGGGKHSTEKQNPSSGLNMQLPDAHLQNDKDENKLSFYQKAEQDSAKLKQEIKNDPLFQMGSSIDTSMFPYDNTTSDIAARQSAYKDPNEEKVYQKLADLNRQLNSNPSIQQHERPVQPQARSSNKEDVDRLEDLLKQTGKDSETDPEMDQLNTVMEKILDIQHPERIKDVQKQNSLEHAKQVYPVTSNNYDQDISLLTTDTITRNQDDTLRNSIDLSNRFYSLENQFDPGGGSQNAIKAAIYQTQTVVTGATVKLRLLDNIYVAGVLVPKDNFVFGTVALNGERLSITIRDILFENSLLPVSLSAYDMDGIDGVYIPGAISRDAAKQSTDNALQNIGLNSLDPSIGAQAAGVGIQTTKNLISKKVKLVKVTIKAGYEVLLKNSDNK